MFAGAPRHLHARKTPRGTRIARWYCPESHSPFSLLPDCLAARLPGTLDSLEAVVAHAEQAPSLSAAANALRPDTVEFPGAMRWVRRRIRLVHHVLRIVIGLLPEHLALETTNRYAEVDLEMKAKALQTCAADGLDSVPNCTPRWHSDSELMAFLASL